MALNFIVIGMTSCNNANFSANSGRDLPGVSSTGDAVPSKIPSGNANPDVEEAACLSRVLPVRVVFALDVSASMTTDLRGVAQNVSAFAARLSSLRFSGAAPGAVPVRLGMVSFTNNIIRRVPPTDPAQFAAQIGGLAVVEDNNIDLPEAGLTAVNEAAKMLDDAARTEGEGIPVVVVVTDALAHNQAPGPGGWNCDVSALDGIARMPAARRFALYDASPDETMVVLADRVSMRRVPVSVHNPFAAACSPYTGLAGNGPGHQWAQARGRLFKSRKGAGRSLGFPFKAENLLSMLPSDLEATYRICAK